MSNEEVYRDTTERRDLIATVFELSERSLSPQEWEAIAESLTIIRYDLGDTIVMEGDRGDALYIIEQGTAQVWQESSGYGRVQIGELQTGDLIGELAILTNSVRSATVTANTNMTVIRLDRENFDHLMHVSPSISGSFLRKNYKRLTNSFFQLEKRNEELQASLHARVELGTIFICVVLLLSVYSFVLSYFAEGIESYASRFLEVIMLLAIFWIFRLSKIPLRDFGVNVDGWRKQLYESIFISAIVMLIMLAIKYMYIQIDQSRFANNILIDWSYWDITYVTYIVVAPLQEFIARGVFQNTVARLIVSKYAAIWSVVVTSVLFGTMHLHSSVLLGVAAFVTSWLWGLMFIRHGSLLGVGISHFLIGNFAGLLGLWDV